MSTYRGGTARPDVTLWYGPFDGRWSVTFVLLALGAFLLLVTVNAERESFRSLSCRRPGPCILERGSWLLGARPVQTFDTDTVVEVQQRRTTGKSSRRQLVIVSRGGSELVLAEGAGVPELFARTQPFFASKQPGEVTLPAPASLEGWSLVGVAALVALAAGGWSARSSLRASVRVCVEVLHSEGIVRLTRGRSLPVAVPIADIGGVEVVHERSLMRGPARVCLMCRTSPDVPLLERFAHGSTHATVAVELRDALGLSA